MAARLPHWLVLDARGLAVSALGVALIWAFTGGERVACEAAAGGRWRCAAVRDVVAWQLLGVADRDEVSGPDGLRGVRVQRVVLGRSRGWSAVIDREAGEPFRMGLQPDEEAAEADRDALLAWTEAPAGSLVRPSPAPRGRRWLAWGLTALAGVGLAATAWDRAQGSAPPAPPERRKRTRGP